VRQRVLSDPIACTTDWPTIIACAGRCSASSSQRCAPRIVAKPNGRGSPAAKRVW
jgi:hypothetical protein